MLDEGCCSDWQLNIQVLRTVMMVWGFNWIFALVFGGGSGLLAPGYYHTVPITPHNSPIFPHTIATLIQEVLLPVPPHTLPWLPFIQGNHGLLMGISNTVFSTKNIFWKAAWDHGIIPLGCGDNHYIQGVFFFNWDPHKISKYQIT